MLERDRHKPTSLITPPTRVRFVHFNFQENDIFVRDEFFGNVSASAEEKKRARQKRRLSAAGDQLDPRAGTGQRRDRCRDPFGGDASQSKRVFARWLNQHVIIDVRTSTESYVLARDRARIRKRPKASSYKRADENRGTDKTTHGMISSIGGLDPKEGVSSIVSTRSQDGTAGNTISQDRADLRSASRGSRRLPYRRWPRGGIQLFR